MESAIVRSVVKGVEIFEMDISEFSMDELLIQLNEILLFQQKNRHRILFFLIKIGKVPVSIKSIELCKKLILNMSLGSATAVAIEIKKEIAMIHGEELTLIAVASNSNRRYPPSNNRSGGIT